MGRPTTKAELLQAATEKYEELNKLISSPPPSPAPDGATHRDEPEYPADSCHAPNGPASWISSL